MDQGRPRHRRGAREEDLATTAQRRLASLTQPLSGGWVPARPPGDPPAEGGEARRVVRPRRVVRSRAAAADRVPPVLRAAVVAPAGRAVAGLVLVVLLAVVAALAATWLSRPREQPLAPRPRTVGAPLTTAPAASAAGAPPAAGTPTPSAPPEVVVHVAGEVRHPGLVELPAGSRVADAVEAAGGATRRAVTSSVNLARPLVDGEQVVVLGRNDQPAVVAPGGAPRGAPGAGAGPVGTSGPVNLNTATLEQLDALPGIGPVLAQRILDWRTANGRFTAVDELGEVSGIGEATLADLRPVVTV